ncbi:hypothetical protein [Saccharothrix sp.]|uniref:hypothetical protein n=1 Tax=Saccharothrix sp. TaxID=1873460 RepID=UPI002810B71B|nr:hypothetical protein [Saccharothrix sp.]
MADEMAPSSRERRLLETYSTYDEHVDVISAFEWMFTQVKDLAATVRHFERFPKIAIGRKVELTPDFTVLFSDGSAIVGEIAKIAVHENSVDKLCRQLGNYDALTSVPVARGELAKVEQVDVLQLVNVRVGYAAVQRIIVDRYTNAAHPYKPSRAPTIVQYARDREVYTFQRILHPDNGDVVRGERTPNIGDYLDQGLNIKAAHFVKIKAERALINDQVDPLYMATHLWAKTWPSMYGVGSTDIVIKPAETADVLRRQHGVGRALDVKNALELLEAAGLAAKEDAGSWRISRKLLGRSGDREVHSIIARRACAPKAPKSVVSQKRLTVSEVEQGTLF